MKFIGIDPDSKKSGIAIWDSVAKNFILLKAADFFNIIEILNEHKDAKVFIEDSSTLPANFHKSNQNAVIREKIAYHVGRCVQISLLLQQFCEHNKIDYKAIIPKRSKTTREQFKLYTKKEIKNQDIIDAAMLVFGL